MIFLASNNINTNLIMVKNKNKQKQSSNKSQHINNEIENAYIWIESISPLENCMYSTSSDYLCERCNEVNWNVWTTIDGDADNAVLHCQNENCKNNNICPSHKCPFCRPSAKLNQHQICQECVDKLIFHNKKQDEICKYKIVDNKCKCLYCKKLESA